MSDVEMVEPSCIARMRRNQWPAARIAELFGTNILAVAKAIQDADAAERGIPKQRIVAGKLK